VAKVPGRGALAQLRKLRKDEPHPVTDLRASGKLRAHLGVDRCLRIDETLDTSILLSGHG